MALNHKNLNTDDGNGRGDYSEANIHVLGGTEAIRCRPEMFVGGTNVNGLHRLIFEVIDNSIDEAMASHCSKIEVTVHADGLASVVDDGRGIPVGAHQQFTDQSMLEVVLTKLH